MDVLDCTVVVLDCRGDLGLKWRYWTVVVVLDCSCGIGL